MPHSFSHAVSMNLEHSIKEGSHERYPVHLQCLRNIKKIKYPDFQAMTKILDDEEGNLDTVLCISTSKVHILLNAYHSSILGGQTGITKCYHTISQRFYCPNLAENLRAYIAGCHVCQMFKKGKDFKRPHQKRINLNVPAMTKISMDIEQMPVNKGYSHILVLLCEATNYMVALPLVSTRTPHILGAFQRGYLACFGPPTH